MPIGGKDKIMKKTTLKNKKSIRRAKFLDVLLLVLTLISLVSAVMAIICLAAEENPEVATPLWEFWLTKLAFTALFGGVSGVTGYIATQLYSVLIQFEY